MSAVAGFVQLVRHDLRIMGRRIAAMARGAGGRRFVLFVIAAVAIFHALAWPFALTVAEDAVRDPLAIDLAVMAGLAFVLPWIVSQALTNATRALYSRGDLDLVLASPVSPAAFFAARALAIAIESVVSIAIFLLPVANMLAIVAGPRWLAIYPMLAICGLFGTAVGLVLTMLLFRVAGPRRTRTLSQVFATIIGASFALGLQAANLAPSWMHQAVRARAPDRDHVLSLPVRAATGDPGSLVVLGLVSIVAFVVVTRALGVAFARGLAQTVDAPGSVRTRSARRAFRTGPGPALRRKEWRLLRRDPWLASQMLLQIAYTVPLCFVLWRTLGPDRGVVAAIGPAIVVIAAQAAGALAWITLSTEDAPEFLLTAPVSAGAVPRAKLTAVAVPLAVVLGLPLAILGVTAPAAAAATFAFATAAACSTALLNLWRPAPGKRGDMLRRTGQSKLVGILEHVLALLWAVAIALFSAGSALFFLPVAVALLVLLANRRGTVHAG